MNARKTFVALLIATGSAATLAPDIASADIYVRVAPPPPRYERSYGALFSAHIGQAEKGCDFDFLANTGPVKEPEIH